MLVAPACLGMLQVSPFRTTTINLEVDRRIIIGGESFVHDFRSIYLFGLGLSL